MEIRGGEYGLYSECAKDQKQFDSTYLVVDKMMKSSHFLLVKTSYGTKEDTKFISNSWRDCMGYYCLSYQTVVRNSLLILKLNTTFHPQINGQVKRIILILEDKLRACMLDFNEGWDDY